jgi:hypothetical protein
VSGRIGEYTLAVKLRRSELKNARRRRGDIFDHDIEVDLLRNRRVRPGGRSMMGRSLKRQARRLRVGRHHDPAIADEGDRIPQQTRVKACQGLRIGAVEHEVMKTTDHDPNAATSRAEAGKQVPPGPTLHGRAGRAPGGWRPPRSDEIMEVRFVATDAISAPW